MIVETSALVAILLGEPEQERLRRAISAAPHRLVSAAAVVECALVMHGRLGVRGVAQVDALIAALEMTIAPVTEEQARVAVAAYLRFGRGTGSPARLNYGDCFGYALASTTHHELLFVGEDFTHTDLTPAPW